MQRFFRKSVVGTSAALGLLLASHGWAQSFPEQDQAREFDARSELNRGAALQMPAVQAAAIDAMRAVIPDLNIRWDSEMGTLTTLSSNTGYLTGPAKSGDAMAAALAFVNGNLSALGLSAADLASYRVTDVVVTKQTGTSHIYLEQTYQGIPVYGAALQINVNADGRVLSVNNTFMPNLAKAVNGERPEISAAAAMVKAMSNIGQQIAEPTPTGPAAGVTQVTPFSGAGISSEPMKAQLVYLPVRAGEVRLAWQIGTMWTTDGQHTYEFNVDAQSGQVWTRFDTTSAGSFRVFPLPAEDPFLVTPVAPADGRKLVVNPENKLASPNGWLVGNSLQSMNNPNVRACTDRDNDNQCDLDTLIKQPTCSGTTCDFPLNLAIQPAMTNADAAITNLFYLNNTIHDIEYQYGFDEASGNFQNNTFNRGGVGNDAVFAQAQDGGGNCNANFSTPRDGSPGRMQMFLCNRATPSRDGDLDSTVVVHEYGHGMSTRQVGGPNRTAASCLRGPQQAGEGWSDWFGLVYTGKVGDKGPDTRGTGSYLFAKMPASGTIRQQPYSTDQNVNNFTYASINPITEIHAVGAVWTEAIWEMYWALTDKYGFEQDLVNFDPKDPKEAGNKRALFYINEGFKNTACPQTGLTFIDNRNGVIAAATDSFGGADVCTIWKTFAAYGLGVDATSVDANPSSARNGFQVPAMCQGKN